MKTAAIVIPAVALLVGAGAFLLLAREAPPRDPASATPEDPVVVPLADAVALVTRASKVQSAEQTGLLADARAQVVALERNHSGDPRLPFWRGIIDVMSHKEADATAAYERLCALAPSGPRNSQSLYLRAIHVLEFDPEHASEAVRKLRTLRAQSPEFMAEPAARALFRALVVVHGVQTRGGDYSKAIDSLKEALLAVGDHTDLGIAARRALAYAYGRAGEWPDAERQWQDLVTESKGELGEPHFGLAAAYAAQNRWSDADAEYTIVLDLLAKAKGQPALAAGLREAWLRRGNCRRLLERFAEAKADIEEYLKLAPDDHRAQFWLGVVWNDGFQKPQTALELWAKARAAAPWCDNYAKAVLRVYETTAPDPVKAAALRADLEANKKAHEDERNRRALSGEFNGVVCE